MYIKAGELPVMHSGDVSVCTFAHAIPYTCIYSIEYTRVQHGTHVGANAYTHVYSYTHTQVFVTLHLSGTVVIMLTIMLPFTFLSAWSHWVCQSDAGPPKQLIVVEIW